MNRGQRLRAARGAVLAAAREYSAARLENARNRPIGVFTTAQLVIRARLQTAEAAYLDAAMRLADAEARSA